MLINNEDLNLIITYQRRTWSLKLLTIELFATTENEFHFIIKNFNKFLTTTFFVIKKHISYNDHGSPLLVHSHPVEDQSLHYLWWVCRDNSPSFFPLLGHADQLDYLLNSIEVLLHEPGHEFSFFCFFLYLVPQSSTFGRQSDFNTNLLCHWKAIWTIWNKKFSFGKPLT